MEGTALDPTRNPDFYLITSDCERIHVNIKALCMQSLVFESMMEMPPTKEDENTCEISENKTDTWILLNGIKTGRVSTLEEFETIRKLIDKYNISWFNGRLGHSLEWIVANGTLTTLDLFTIFSLSFVYGNESTGARIGVFNQLASQGIAFETIQHSKILTEEAKNTLLHYIMKRAIYLRKQGPSMYFGGCSSHETPPRQQLEKMIVIDSFYLKDPLEMFIRSVTTELHREYKCGVCVEQMFQSIDFLRSAFAREMRQIAG